MSERGAQLGSRLHGAVSGSTKQLTLVATILGSSIAILDTSVVSVALPPIQRSLGGGLAGQQWVSNAYLLTLGSLILLGGSLGDIFGQPSSELFERVAEAVAEGRIIAPPITRISLEEVPALLGSARAQPVSGKTVITL